MHLKNPTGDRKLEQVIARRVLRRILKAGYGVAVFDSEELHEVTHKEKAAWDAMGETDMDRLYVYGPSTAGQPERIGSILLVWGEGDTIVTDWSWNTRYADSEAIMNLLATGDANWGTV